jgi:hypothetical protein
MKKTMKDEALDLTQTLEETPNIFREKIGVLTRNFSYISSSSPHLINNFIKNWTSGEIVRVQSDIDTLINLGAPIEVYYRDVDRTAKG